MLGENHIRAEHSIALDARVAIREFHASVSSPDMGSCRFVSAPAITLFPAREQAFRRWGFPAALGRIVNLQQSDDKATLSLISGGEGRDD